MGTLRQRVPGVWELRVYAGRDERGRPVQVSRTFRGGERAAKRALVALEGKVNDGEVDPRSRDTVAGLLKAYLDDRARTLSPATISVYRSSAKRLGQTKLAAKRLDRVTALDVDAAYGELRDAGIGPFALSQCHRFLRSAWRQGIRWQLVRSNPVAEAQPPKVPRRGVTAPSPDDVRRLLEELERRDVEVATMLFLGAATGLRRGALCGLQWGDLADGSLTVSRSIVLADGVLVERPPKMRAKGETETVALAPAALAALEVLLELQEDRRRSLGRPPVAAGDWILSADGLGATPLDPAVLNRKMARACRAAGLPRISPHDLRHFAATQMVAGGIPVDVVARRLHHRNPAITLQAYSHPTEADDLKAALALERALSPDTTKAPGPKTGGDASVVAT